MHEPCDDAEKNSWRIQHAARELGFWAWQIYWYSPRTLCKMVNDERDRLNLLLPDHDSHDDEPVHKLSFDLFEIKGKLGQGAFGEVWRVIDSRDNETYALKLITNVDAQSKREVAILTAFSALIGRHKNIVSYYGQFQAIYNNRWTHVIKMEFIDGISIMQWFGKNGQPDKPIICHMLVGAFDGLKTLHANGILHLDIKPDNLMIRAHTNDVVLIDFGLSCTLRRRANDPVAGCASQADVGTPQFASPIRVLDCAQHPEKCTHDVLQSSDVFALALSFYDALTKGVALLKLIAELDRKPNWLLAYENYWLEKVWKPLEVYPRDAAVDALLRKALVGNDKDRPTAQQLWDEAQRICPQE
jgi:serine/threonine protein kinase